MFKSHELDSRAISSTYSRSEISVYNVIFLSSMRLVLGWNTICTPRLLQGDHQWPFESQHWKTGWKGSEPAHNPGETQMSQQNLMRISRKHEWLLWIGHAWLVWWSKLQQRTEAYPPSLSTSLEMPAKASAFPFFIWEIAVLISSSVIGLHSSSLSMGLNG